MPEKSANDYQTPGAALRDSQFVKARRPTIQRGGRGQTQPWSGYNAQMTAMAGANMAKLAMPNTLAPQIPQARTAMAPAGVPGMRTPIPMQQPMPMAGNKSLISSVSPTPVDGAGAMDKVALFGAQLAARTTAQGATDATKTAAEYDWNRSARIAQRVGGRKRAAGKAAVPSRPATPKVANAGKGWSWAWALGAIPTSRSLGKMALDKLASINSGTVTSEVPEKMPKPVSKSNSGGINVAGEQKGTNPAGVASAGKLPSYTSDASKPSNKADVDDSVKNAAFDFGAAMARRTVQAQA